MKELYKDIKGYENLYQISNLGNVKSLAKGDGNGNRDRILKPGIEGKLRKTNQEYSYRSIRLCKKGITEKFAIHRLVALHFISNPKNKPFVNHKDSRPSNNHKNNLEWCTHIENMTHCVTEGRHPGKQNGLSTRPKAEEKIKTHLGKLFISLKYYNQPNGKPRQMPTYNCRICNTQYTARTDSTLYKNIVCSRRCNNKFIKED